MKIIMIAASTVCGRISPVPLGSDLDRRFLEEMRDNTDASLMGSGTLRRENPQMGGVDGVREGRLRAFITYSGMIPLHGKRVFQNGPKPLVFTGKIMKDRLGHLLQDAAEVISLPDFQGVLSLEAALHELEKRGAQSVLIEGGAGLNYHALQQNVVDEVMVTITPQLSGNENEPSLADGPAGLGGPFLPLQLLSCRPAETGEIFAHYRIDRSKNK